MDDTDVYERPAVPRTIESWRTGQLRRDLAQLARKASRGDLDAQAMLDALRRIKHYPARHSG